MKMKLLWFLVIILTTSPDSYFSSGRGKAKASTWTRKLKEESYDKRSYNSGSSIELDDYYSIDPPPSSGVITSGPIEHGSPIIPYIPKPKPGCDSNIEACPPAPSPFPSA